MHYPDPPHSIQAPMANKAISVSELNRQVKRLLEISYAQTWVQGEISSFSRPASGHWYFTLKDDRSQIRCAMFRGFNQRLKFLPKEGDELIVRGKVSLYEGRGDYQLIVENLEPAGLGQLQAAFDALKLKLSSEGLFDEQNKKPLPRIPKKIAVITSRTGAVIHDIISVTSRRFPATEIVLLPVTVQGEYAAQEIAQAIKIANKQHVADVIIVGRGGGSLEDLWAFNEEVVARAIFKSELPVISAVGHEVDVSIADMVADYRAPTPSAAAERLTPDVFELTQKLDDLQHRLGNFWSQRIHRDKERLHQLQARLKHPRQHLQERSRQTLELFSRLDAAMQRHIKDFQQTLKHCETRLRTQRPKKLIEAKTQMCYQLWQTLNALQAQQLSVSKNRLALAAQTLNTVSPLATMDRGYSILTHSDQRIVRDSSELAKGDEVTARLSKGYASLTVKSVTKSPNTHKNN